MTETCFDWLLREREQLATLLSDPEHPARRSGYVLPQSEEQLADRRGLAADAQGARLFGGGAADYAHSLLASWSAAGEGPGAAALLRDPSGYGELYAKLAAERRIVTTAWRGLLPAAAGQPVVRETDADGGCLLGGSLHFDSDAWFADELLIHVPSYGGADAARLVLVQSEAEGVERSGAGPLPENGVRVSLDCVRIPPERVLAVDDQVRRLWAPPWRNLADGQWQLRQREWAERLAGLVFGLADTLPGGPNLEQQGALAELLQRLDVWKALLQTALADGKLLPSITEAGEGQADGDFGKQSTRIFLPATVPLLAAGQEGRSAIRYGLRLLDEFSIAELWLAEETERDDGRQSGKDRLRLLLGSEAGRQERLRELHAFGSDAGHADELLAHYPQERLREPYRRFYLEEEGGVRNGWEREPRI